MVMITAEKDLSAGGQTIKAFAAVDGAGAVTSGVKIAGTSLTVAQARTLATKLESAADTAEKLAARAASLAQD